MTDTGYLQHGTAGQPMRTEAVPLRQAPWPNAGSMQARYEGKWCLVHLRRAGWHIVHKGQRIPLVIEGARNHAA